jgi:putative transposase
MTINTLTYDGLPEPPNGRNPVIDGWLDEFQARPEKLDEAARYAVYSHLGLRRAVIEELEAMISTSPARKVGAGALHNVKGMFYSKTNGAHRAIESHTCEGVFAHQLELDPNVIGYYTQVHCTGIKRITKNGRKHLSSATMDFLVFRNDSLSLVECKYRSTIEKKYSRESNTDWIIENDIWRHGPYETWAKERGLSFNVWIQDTPFSIEQENLEAIYALISEILPSEERAIADKALANIAKQPSSIAMLSEEIKGFYPRIALWLMANTNVFGLVRSVSVKDESLFHLYSSKNQANEVDLARFDRIQKDLEQPDILDPLLLASPVDVNRAKIKLAKLRLVQEGKAPKSGRMCALQRKVDAAIQLGLSPLGACLTNFKNCGKTGSTLSKKQKDIMCDTVKNKWHKNDGAITRRDLHFYLEDNCLVAGVETPGYTTLCDYLRTLNPTMRALAVGGARCYQAVRSRTDATKRSGPAIGYGYHLIIDSSQFDQRCVTHTLDLFSTAKPTFYVGIDSASGDIMAFSMFLGKSSIAGLAMLLRDFELRHGFMPSVIQFDRGTENESKWLREFCEFYGITFLHTPTGGSRYNSAAESTIKMVNFQLAHKGAGSTAPDMAGRKVDGRFKSIKTVKHELNVLYNNLDEFVSSALKLKPNNQGYSPTDLKNDAVTKYGVLGRACIYDYTFIINTSIKYDLPKKATERDGIQTAYGRYTSDSLQLALRSDLPDEIRRDCADPSRIYVKVRSKWYTAFNQNIMSFVNLSNFDKMFASMTWPLLKSMIADEKISIQRRSHQHLLLPPPPNSSNPVNGRVAVEIDSSGADTIEEIKCSIFFTEKWNKVSPEFSDDGY